MQLDDMFKAARQKLPRSARVQKDGSTIVIEDTRVQGFSAERNIAKLKFDGANVFIQMFDGNLYHNSKYRPTDFESALKEINKVLNSR